MKIEFSFNIKDYKNNDESEIQQKIMFKNQLKQKATIRNYVNEFKDREQDTIIIIASYGQT